MSHRGVATTVGLAISLALVCYAAQTVSLGGQQHAGTGADVAGSGSSRRRLPVFVGRDLERRPPWRAARGKGRT